MNTNTTSGAAIQRYKIGYHADEWGQRSSAPSGIPDASGSWHPGHGRQYGHPAPELP